MQKRIIAIVQCTSVLQIYYDLIKLGIMKAPQSVRGRRVSLETYRLTLKILYVIVMH